MQHNDSSSDLSSEAVTQKEAVVRKILRFRPDRFSGLMALCVALQLGFWSSTYTVKPDLGIVPTPPGPAAVHALALGDDEFYFRLFAFHMQNFGDTFGRVTSLRNYDFSKLSQWWLLLDGLNSRSDMIPSMATYYFSQTQNAPDIRYIVDYLYTHAMRNPEKKWWWLLQTIYLSMHKLNDMDMAIKAAQPMMNPAVPVWAQQMVAVVHEKRGEMEDALRIMQTIKDNAHDISDQDLRYMTYFVKERIKKLDKDAAHQPPR